MPKIAPSSGERLRVSPSYAGLARNDDQLGHRQRLVGRDIPQRARTIFGAGHRRHRDERHADACHCHHHADHRSRYRRGELLYLGGDALHDRLDRWRRFDRDGVVAARRTARLHPQRRSFRAGDGVLRAGTKYRRADCRARCTGVGRRAGLGKRHGANCKPVRPTAAYTHHRDFTRHLYRLPSEWTDRRRRVRGNAMVARLLLDDGAVDAGFCRARLLENP